MGFLLLMIILFCGFVYLARLGRKAAQKRIEALRAYAQNNGLSFSPEKDTALAAQFPFFSILHQGHSQYAFNVMRGNYKGLNSLAFSYHYAVTTRDSKGRSQTSHYYLSAVILKTDFPLKALSIRPENFFDKIGEFLGADDIDFESAEFSKKFFVQAQDKKFAYGIIHQGMMEYLLANPLYLINTDHNEILIYKSGTFAPVAFGACFDFGIEFIKKIPDYLIKELKEGA